MKPLYWSKPYQKIFTAKVIDVTNNAIILDKTLFYATAGNQIHDTGTITIDKKSYKVINVVKEEEKYLHITDPKPSKLLIGSSIRGNIDWDRRYLVMKAHTAQHIISAVMLSQWNNKTLHANIKPGEFTIEFEQKIPREQLDAVMQESNLVFTSKNRKVKSHILEHDDANAKYADKIRGKIPNVDTVRILEVEGIDYNTCGGIHIRNTSEIGFVFVSDIHREREIDFYLGEKALRFLSSGNVNLVYSQIQLNCSFEEYPNVFYRRLLDLQELQQKEKDYGILIMNFVQSTPFDIINELKFRYLEADLPKKVVFNEFKKFEPDTILCIKVNQTQYLILSSSKTYSASLIVEKLKELHGGKGGGSALNAQISFDNQLNTIQEDIKQIITN